VRFDWRWRSPQDAADTANENERHSTARRREPPAEPDAPPLVLEPDAPLVLEPERDPAAAWWGGLTDAEREAWADQVGRTFEAGGRVVIRRERDLRELAFEAAQ